MKSHLPAVIAPIKIPEVVEFLDAKDQYEAFKEEHGLVLEQLELLAERYNAALQAAEKAVRAKGVTCGPFEAYQVSVKFNADALFDAVGLDRFISLGGKVVTRESHEIDSDRLGALIDRGGLPKEVVDVIRTVSPKYHKPSTIELP